MRFAFTARFVLFALCTISTAQNGGPPLQPELFQGPHRLSIMVEYPGGKPAAEHNYSLFMMKKDGSWAPVRTGYTARSGGMTLDNIPAGPDVPRTMLRFFDGERTLDVRKLPLEKSPPPDRITVTIPPQTGDRAPDIRTIDIATGETRWLSDDRGKVIVLCFWASWCGPCQKCLRTLHEVVQKRGDFDGKAAFLAVSIDDKLAAAQEHIQKKGWGDLRAVWHGDDFNRGWDSRAAETYAVKATPTFLVIDKTGEIRWRGVFPNFDIEERIDHLIAK